MRLALLLIAFAFAVSEAYIRGMRAGRADHTDDELDALDHTVNWCSCRSQGWPPGTHILRLEVKGD